MAGWFHHLRRLSRVSFLIVRDGRGLVQVVQSRFYVPPAMLARILALPLTGFTLDWYQRLFATPALLRAAGSSLVVAFSSSLVATALGQLVWLQWPWRWTTC